MKETILNQLGNRVRELREELELTQEQLAGKARISLKYIQRIEGKTPPDVGTTTLEKLAKGFDIPLWKLLKF
jgi:transcriptional regulator with XRE-family HTH domain